MDRGTLSSAGLVTRAVLASQKPRCRAYSLRPEQMKSLGSPWDLSHGIVRHGKAFEDLAGVASANPNRIIKVIFERESGNRFPLCAAMPKCATWCATFHSSHF